MEVTIQELFDAMSVSDRCHMVNKLNKEGYQPQKLVKELEEQERIFGMVSDACDFWKQEAIDRGFEE